MDLIKEANFLLEHLEPITQTHINLIEILKQYIEYATAYEYIKQGKDQHFTSKE